MGNLFNLDNGFFSFMSKAWDMVMLSILWLFLCLPLVTIGPSTTALYYTVVKVVRKERGYITREFFRSFKDNLKNGIIVSVFYLVCAFILFVDYQYARSLIDAGQKLGLVFITVFNVITLLLVMMLVFIFPVLSRFTLGVKQLFKTSFLMAIRHFPTTICLVIIVGVFGIGMYIILPAIFFVPSICCLLCSFFIERVFKKYMPKAEESEEANKDQWYLE